MGGKVGLTTQGPKSRRGPSKSLKLKVCFYLVVISDIATVKLAK